MIKFLTECGLIFVLYVLSLFDGEVEPTYLLNTVSFSFTVSYFLKFVFFPFFDIVNGRRVKNHEKD